MEQNITNTQIEFFKHIIELYEPYSLEELEKLKLDDKEHDPDRINATIAKKILIENGIIDD